MKATAKRIRISPLKTQVVADLIRGKSVNDALALLKFMPKKAAKILADVVHSAASNAEANFKQDRDKLMIKRIVINKGPTLKRGRPVSKGRWHPILKRTTQIYLEVDTL
jgi:large subunit ribosomal protein L22